MSEMVERVARAIAGPNGSWIAYVTEARAAIDAVRDALNAGRFAEWSDADLAAQCRMQASDNIDPEYSQFMRAVSDRLAPVALHALPPAEPEEPTAEMVEAGARAVEIAIVEKTMHHPVSSLLPFMGWLWPIVARAAYLAMRAARPAGGREGGA